MSKYYDSIVIGRGSDGLSVAERAARYAKHCVVVESGKLGGTGNSKGTKGLTMINYCMWLNNNPTVHFNSI
jgi:glycine/D-amino acid oxidase-like deaminating enzyme